MNNPFVHPMGRLALAAALALSGLATATAGPGTDTAKATFTDAQGTRVGTAQLTQTPSGVLIELDLKGLPPGEKAFHIHEKGACDPRDAFKSAGAHFDPRSNQHGLHAAKGPHAGDMPNQFVRQDGVLRAHVLNTVVMLPPGEATLFDDDGSSLVLHAKPDDYRSQPAGDAGDRIACAVIERGAR